MDARNLKFSLLILSIIGTAGGCTMSTEEERAKTPSEDRVDCSTPGEDIEKLMAEKKRVTEESGGGALTAVPDPAVVEILGGDDTVSEQTPIDQYIDKIDQRVLKIREICLPDVQCPNWVIRSMC